MPALPGASTSPQAVEEEIPKQKERTHFTVRLTEAKPVDKVKLIKEIKNYIPGINLVQVSSVCGAVLLLSLTWQQHRDWPLLGQVGTEPRPNLTLLYGRQRSWWSPCPRKLKPTSPRQRRRRSRQPWRRWVAPWFWSRPL